MAGAVDDEPSSGDQDEQDRAGPDLDAEARSNQDLDLHTSRPRPGPRGPEQPGSGPPCQPAERAADDRVARRPLIFTGLRLGWGTALLLIVGGEFVGARSGLGYLIWNSWQTFAVDERYAGLLVISAPGLISFALFDQLERRLVPWRGDR